MNFHRAPHRFRHPNRRHRAHRPTRAPLRHPLECLESRELLSVSPLQLEAKPMSTPQLITPSIMGPAQPAARPRTPPGLARKALYRGQRYT
jgi:hypothetical protein